MTCKNCMADVSLSSDGYCLTCKGWRDEDRIEHIKEILHQIHRQFREFLIDITNAQLPGAIKVKLKEKLYDADQEIVQYVGNLVLNEEQHGEYEHEDKKSKTV